MGAEYIENLAIPLIRMDNKKMCSSYKFFDSEMDMVEKKSKLKEFLADSTVEVENFEEMCEKLDDEYTQIKQDRSDLRSFIFKAGEEDIAVPINVHRLIQNSKEMFSVKQRNVTSLSPSYAIKQVQDLLQNGIKVYKPNRMENMPLLQEANSNATWLFKIYLRTMLCTKHLI